MCEQEEVEECDEEGTVCDTVQVTLVMIMIILMIMILTILTIMMILTTDGGMLHQVRGGVRDCVQGEVLHRVRARVHNRWDFRLLISVANNHISVHYLHV